MMSHRKYDDASRYFAVDNGEGKALEKLPVALAVIAIRSHAAPVSRGCVSGNTVSIARRLSCDLGSLKRFNRFLCRRTATMQANQLRLYFSPFAYVLMHGRLGLVGTQHAVLACSVY